MILEWELSQLQAKKGSLALFHTPQSITWFRCNFLLCSFPYLHALKRWFIRLNLFINGFFSSLFQQLNSIERLFGLSANARQCYQLNKFSFNDAINTAKSTAMQCINDKFNEGKTIADNAINNIRTAVQDVSNGAQLIAECRQFTVEFPSVAGFVAKVTCLSQVLFSNFTLNFQIEFYALIFCSFYIAPCLALNLLKIPQIILRYTNAVFNFK